MRILFVRPQASLPALSAIKTFVGEDFSPPEVDVEEDPGAWLEWLPEELQGPGQPSVVVKAPPGQAGLLLVRSKADHVAARAAYFLASESAGTVAFQQEGPYQPPEVLVQQFGDGLQLEAARERVRRLRMRLPRFFAEHLGFLAEHVPGELTYVSFRDRGAVGRCTHPQSLLPLWLGMGPERWSAFAAAADLPDGFFACMEVGYPHQEWALVLWNRAGRRFWFGSGYFHYNNENRTPAATAAELRAALQEWARSDESVFFLGGAGRVRPHQ